MPSSTSPSWVLMLPSSVTNGRLSPLWYLKEPGCLSEKKKITRLQIQVKRRLTWMLRLLRNDTYWQIGVPSRRTGTEHTATTTRTFCTILYWGRVTDVNTSMCTCKPQLSGNLIIVFSSSFCLHDYNAENWKQAKKHEMWESSAKQFKIFSIKNHRKHGSR